MEKVLLFVGRLVEEKGLQYLLPAIKNLPDTLQVKLLIVGREKKNLARICSANKMENAVYRLCSE